MAVITANLEDRLGQALPHPCRHVGDPHSFWMEGGGAKADQDNGQEHEDVRMGKREKEDTSERKADADRQQNGGGLRSAA